MIVHLLFTVVVLGLTVFNYYFGRRNVLYPAFLFALIWFVALFLYMMPLIEVEKLGAHTLVVVVSGVAAFSGGAAIVVRWRNSRPVRVFTCRNTISKRAIFFCCLAILPFFFFEIRRLSAGADLASFMLSARAATTDAVTNEGSAYSSPIYTAALMLTIFIAFVFLIESREWRRERVWVWASILTAVVFSILTTGRTWLLELAAGLVGIYLLKSGRTSVAKAWKFVRWPMASFLVLFAILVPVNKDMSSLNGSVTEAIANYAFGYTIVPLEAFDYVLQHPSEYKYEPNHTFRQVLPVLARFSGLRYTPPPSLDDYIFVPSPTNVYTVFKFYYVDFGFTGMLIAMLLIGAGQTWLFRRALTGDHLYVFLFAVSLFPLTMVAFDDLYSGIRSYLVALIFAALYFRVLRTIPLHEWAGFHSPRSRLMRSRSETGTGNSA
jgi:oligosaccharide repeat unit polymerase